MRFDGRVAVVTGGGSGSGQGASPSAADAVVETIRAAGGDAVASYDSVATREGGAAIVATAMKTFGRVDILVNNAGFLRNNRFEDLSDAEIDAVLSVHLKGAFHVTQPAYRVMKDQRYGRILFTASASGLYGHPWQANYGAAKAGLVGLMNVVALEGQRHGILANALLPTANTRLAAEMNEGWMEATNVSGQLGSIDFAAIADGMGVERNTPLVLYLVSERCTATHACFSALGGRYAEVFIGSAYGWSAGPGRLATPEDVTAHWVEITDLRRYHRPLSVYEEFAAAIARIRAAEAST